MRKLSLFFLLAMTGCPDPLTSNGQTSSQSNSPNAVGSQGPNFQQNNPNSKRFKCTEGVECVDISGEFVYEGEQTGSVRIDILKVSDGKAPEMVHTLNLNQIGSFEFKAPKNTGELIIEGFIDQNADGPTLDDPKGFIKVKVEDSSVDSLQVVVTDDGKRPARPGQNQEPPPNPDDKGPDQKQDPNSQPPPTEGTPSGEGQPAATDPGSPAQPTDGQPPANQPAEDQPNEADTPPAGEGTPENK